jgi:hypothetical protein
MCLRVFILNLKISESLTSLIRFSVDNFFARVLYTHVSHYER